MVIDSALIIIQARVNSNRLPNKVMSEIDGKPLIGYIFDRLKKSKLKILLATSTEHENDKLVDYAIEQNVDVFRGSENNVLERFYLASKEKKAEVIIRVTGDNPLIDGQLIRKEVVNYINNNNKMAYHSAGRSKTFPLGMSFEIFSKELLGQAYENSNLPGQFEHVTPYMHQNVSGDTMINPIYYIAQKSNYRVTVDTQEDFVLMEELITKFKCHLMSVDKIVEVLDMNPYLSDINIETAQKKWDD